METQSNILAWKIPWAEELGGLQSTGHKKSDMTEQVNTCTHLQSRFIFQFFFFFCRHRWLYPGRATGREGAMRKLTLVNGSLGGSQTTGSWEDLELYLFIYLFIIFSFIFIGWRLITLQYCSGFCHTLAWISHGFTCIPHLIPPPTSLSTRFLWVFPVHQGWALGTLNVMWIHPLKLFTQQIFIKHESWADKRDTLKWMGSWSQSNEKIWEVRILKEINWKYWKWGLKHELFEIETMEEGL